MKTRAATASAQEISAERAASLVRTGMWLDYGPTLAQPDVFDTALGARITELADIKMRNCIAMRPRAVLENDPDGKHVHCISLHLGGYDRKMHDSGRCSYLPVNLGEIPDYYRRFMPPSDMLILKTCPMDADGFFNLGPTILWHRAIVERARMVIVETSTAMPRVVWRGGQAACQRGRLRHRG